MTRVPNLYLLGAQKAGTTWLAKSMALSSEIHLPVEKEPHVLDRPENGTPRQQFAACFGDAPDVSWLVDATPNYLCHGPGVPEAVAGLVDDPRFIVVLRDPADRMYSAVRHMIATGRLPLRVDPDDVVAAALSGRRDDFRLVDFSDYLPALERWLEVHDASRFLFLSYRSALGPDGDGLGRIADFLELREPIPVATASRVNAGPKSIPARFVARRVPGGRRLAPVIDRWAAPRHSASKVEMELRRRFDGDRARIEELTGLDLSDWSLESNCAA